MFYQCTLPVQTIELKSVGVRLACRRAFVPAPDVGCSSRHLAERDPLNALARVARRAWTTEEMRCRYYRCCVRPVGRSLLR